MDFSNMKIGQRLMVALAGILVFIIVVVGVVAYSITDLRSRQATLYNRDMLSTLDLLTIENNVNRMRGDLFFMLLNLNSSTVREQCETSIRKAAQENTKIFPELKQRFADDPKNAAVVHDLDQAFTDFQTEQDNDLLPAIRSHDIDKAKMIIFGGQGAALQNIIDIADRLGHERQAAAKDSIITSGRNVDAALGMCLIISIVGVGFSAVACWSFARSLTGATEQLTNAVSVLGEGVEQILASVSDSASGTTQTATAVNETTATVEELKQTSQLSSDKARSVYESAQRAEEISTAGRQATDATVEGMKRIRKQMDQIAESMGHLSEKARNIVEIIATVDDLAKQSNLLAVNAAIEAAKAGEQGKGFAVVAQQVKSMSDQSKQATAQVRAILDEIQSAAGSAAKATELGSQAVDAAVRQSSQAGESIVILTNSVSESAMAAAQIASASKQQVVGVDQVVTAMLGIKDAASQNVTAISRVEQAANNLSELGVRLKQLVQRY